LKNRGVVVRRADRWCRSERARLWAGLGAIGCLGMVEGAASAQSFTGIGFLGAARYSIAYGTNADGTVVVGLSDGAFRWTRAGGMQNLGGLVARAVNSDGTVVVGESGNHAFRWTMSG